MLSSLPGELRNRIYEYVAYDAKEVVLFEPDHAKTFPIPFSHVCKQIYQEFNSLHQALPLEFATTITIHNDNFNIWSLLQTLQHVPSPAPNVSRKTTFQIDLTNDLQLVNVKAFITELSRLDIVPYHRARIQCYITFEPETFDLPTWRLHFARLAKQYRFHHSDAEQRVFEDVYWAFAQQAETVDGVDVKQYSLGFWRTGGRLCFV